MLLIMIVMICYRYYIAEGVRIHCQGTWGMLFGVTGVGAVEKHLPSIVPFYIRQSEADNHAVRAF